MQFRLIETAANLAMLAGLMLLALSYAWTSIRPPGSGWTEGDNQRLIQVKEEMASLVKKLAEAKVRGVVPPDEPVAMRVLVDRDRELRARLDESLQAPDRFAERLRVLGVVGLAAGLAMRVLPRAKRGA